jgi:hypothetical protein
VSDEVTGAPVFRYTSAGSFRIALLALTRNEAKRDPTRDAQTRTS